MLLALLDVLTAIDEVRFCCITNWYCFYYPTPRFPHTNVSETQ